MKTNKFKWGGAREGAGRPLGSLDVVPRKRYINQRVRFYVGSRIHLDLKMWVDSQPETTPNLVDLGLRALKEKGMRKNLKINKC